MRPAAIAVLLLLSASSALAKCTAELAAGPVKIRPYGSVRLPRPNVLLCAKNEYCSFQVVVTAAGADCTGVDVELSELVSQANRIPARAATLYRQGFLNIFYRSSSQGDIGEWPDPLLPKIDPDYGERRNAFPFDVSRISPAYKSYRVRRGRTVGRERSFGGVTSSGRYRGKFEKRYVVQISKTGALGQATFQWWSEPGPATRSPEQATTGTPIELEDGVLIQFHSAGQNEDFLAGDEFWIFAGPARRQPIWVDVLIPPDAAPGVYAGDVTVTATGQEPLRLPVKIEVLPFALPSTSTLASSFGLSWGRVLRSHFGASGDEQRQMEIGQLYARAALRNNITVSGGEEFAPEYRFQSDGTLAAADYSRLDRAWGPLLAGQGTPRGARWTSLRLPGFGRTDAGQLPAVIRDFARHAHERGWLNRLFDYTIDEPHDGRDFEQLRQRAVLVRKAAPEVPRLVTTELNPRLQGLVTRWCPVVNYLDPKVRSLRDWWIQRRHKRRMEYQDRLQAGESLWWYQSCMSHGCGGSGNSPMHDNWPSFMVDISGVANRVFGFLSTVTYNVSGILYWDVAFAFHPDPVPQIEKQPLSPWESVYYFGGNGDGTLFYPGRPEEIGGKRHIPIESVRLKMIRDSFYDADYAALLMDLGETEFLEREVGRVIQNAYTWDADPRAWIKLRHRLARRIAERIAKSQF